MGRKGCGGLCYRKDNQFEDLDSLLNVPQGVECLALFPQWEHHIGASEGEKEP